MPAVPAKVTSRLKSQIKKYRQIVDQAKQRDINESDTAIIVTSVLADMLGYDRFIEITSEYAIRGTFCDLAIKLNDKLKLLIEVKAIGLDLKDNHLRQAVDYGAKEGVDWVVLTNGDLWFAYRINFGKPITFEKVFEISLLNADVRDKTVLERLYLLSKEGVAKKALAAYHEEKQATSRYVLAAILQTDALLNTLRREVRKISGGVRVTSEELLATLRGEVLKREVVDGEQAIAAMKMVKRAAPKKGTKPKAQAKKEAVPAQILPSPSESE